MKLKYPELIDETLAAMGVNTDDEYLFDGENLSVVGFNDTQIALAESGLDVVALDKAKRNVIIENQRRESYPDVGSQLDAIWKQIAKLKADGIALDIDADKALKKILDIKKAHKKDK